jgi:Inner membrane component of T3SS, cytoplasmic domain/von Willebrand factor type A domain
MARVARLAIALLCVLFGAAVVASKPALRLERIDPSAFATSGKIRVFASLVELEGQVVDDKAASSFRLRVDEKTTLTPEKVEPFRTAAVPIDLVLVIESAALYGVQKLPLPSVPASPAPTKKNKGKAKTAPPVVAPPMIPRVAPGELPLDRVKEALAGLLEARPAQTRVLIVDYGGEVTPHPPFRPPAAAQSALEDLSPDDESGDVHLVDAVRAALLELNRPRKDEDGPPPRRLIVVVSDGINAQMDRKTFRALGDAAALSGVPIHAIAFSPTDDRGPLINLGEISKRSNGTFRWAKNADELKAQIETLATELDQQYVLTFALPFDKVDGHRYELECEDLRSNRLRFEAGASVFGWSGAIERRSLVWTLLPWTGGVLGVLIALYLLLAIILRITSRKAPLAVLEFVDGPRRGERIALSRRAVVIGKAGAIALDDPAVSTRHAELHYDGRGWRLTDLKSTNGTFVDGTRIDGSVYLQPGNVVQLGQTRLTLVGVS